MFYLWKFLFLLFYALLIFKSLGSFLSLLVGYAVCYFKLLGYR